METKARKRVVFRANGQRQHLEVLARASEESETREGSGGSTNDGCNPRTPPVSPPLRVPQDPVPAETSRISRPRGQGRLFHSTPLHPHLNGSWRGRQRRKRWKKGNRVHPEFHPPSDAVLQHTVKAPQPPSPTPHSTMTYSIQSAPDPSHSLPQSSITTHSILNCSLPPLLSSQLRKGGRRPSVSVDWSSDGVAELRRCLTDGQLGVYVATWNMQQLSDLPDSLDDLLLPGSHEVVSELYVVGTQETTSHHREWAVLVQQTLGPTHVFIHSASLGQLHLFVFVRRDLIWYCSEVQSVGYATRPGVMVKTKGGLGLSFSLFGTSFLFITSHFTAHQHKVQERNSDMQRIADNLTTNGLDEFDYVFWLGDLNYRVDMERTEADQYVQQQASWTPLLLQDQLSKEMLQGHVFQGFSEQPINFPPSYKFDLNSDTYDSSERQRTPSWTDRILFRSRSGSGVVGCGYRSCQSLQCSDHRPVYAIFRVRLEPCTETDGIPDVMADFNRDVYRIAHHRRKEVAQQSLSLREGVDGPTVPPTTTTPRSSICVIL